MTPAADISDWRAASPIGITEANSRCGSSRDLATQLRNVKTVRSPDTRVAGASGRHACRKFWGALDKALPEEGHRAHQLRSLQWCGEGWGAGSATGDGRALQPSSAPAIASCSATVIARRARYDNPIAVTVPFGVRDAPVELEAINGAVGHTAGERSCDHDFERAVGGRIAG